MDPADQFLALANMVVELYDRRPELDEAGVSSILESEGTPLAHAVLAACLVPSAFGRVLIQQLGVEIADEFQVQSERGDWVAYSFSEHPIGRAAMIVAVGFYVHGPRSTFQALATRSVELNAVNKALNSGVDVQGGRCSSTKVYGVFSEQLGDV
jgi:hypothetical protein